MSTCHAGLLRGETRRSRQAAFRTRPSRRSCRDNDLRAAHPRPFTEGVQRLRRKYASLPSCLAAATMIRFDRRDAVVHTNVENDELVHADVGEKDAGADTVLREDQRHTSWRYASECEVAVSADHRRNTWW